MATRTRQVKIVPGETTFRAHYADGNPLWKVLRPQGRGAYVCEIVNEPIEIDGKMLDSDFAGTQKVFLDSEIQGSIGMSALFDGLHNEHDAYYRSLRPGQIIHYDNGFNQYVRCEVVVHEGEHQLKPIALVGNWQSHDLPRRQPNGEIVMGYHPQMIQTGEVMKPNASNLYEHRVTLPKNRQPIGRQKALDPRRLQPIDLSVPPMTAEETETARLWNLISTVVAVLSQSDTDPKARLREGYAWLAKEQGSFQ